MLPGTFNPAPSLGPRFIGADTYSNTSVGDIDTTLSIPGIQTGDIVVVSFAFDTNTDNTWSWDTGGGSANVTGLFDGTGDGNPGYYVGWFTYAGNLRLKTTGVGSNWGDQTLVASAYGGVSTLVDSGGTKVGTPSATGTGTITVLTSSFDDPEDANVSAVPSGYTLAAEVNVGAGTSASASAHAYRVGNATNPSAKVAWDKSGNEFNAVLLFS